jgi:uncharacterized protein (TIGR02145 family)
VEAIVAPHPGTANFTGRTITFATNNGADVKSYTIPDNVTFESGKVYGFTVTYGGGVTPPPFPTYTEDGMTNSYMVAQNGEVSFEVSRAYEYNGSAFTDKLRVANTANYTGGFDAKVLWQDPGDLIESPTSNASAISGSGNTAIVTVKAKNNKSGNAVIGIYKTGTSTLVWSYHIWVTDYMDGGTGKTVSMVNNHVFMDRNLGATAADLTTAAYGLLYQWGRKDPFPGSVSGSAGWNAAGSFSFSSSNKVSDQTATGNAVDIIESIQNPTKFYRDVSSGDWLPARDNNLWQASGGEKTIYDPCPIGWRVPVYKSNTASVANSPWMEYNDPEYINYATDRDWNSTDKGWKFTRGGVDTYYPAAGYRGYNSGFAYSGGVEGIYWSASVNSFNAAVLDFLSTYVLAYSFAYRAYGFSVRCVRE